MSNLEFSKHFFNLKGKRAEDAIHDLAYKSFLREWCYPNPVGPDGKEICDLLVLFDCAMLIVQIKDITYKGNDERYIRKAIEEPIHQLRGAERTLFSRNLNITLANPHGYKHSLEPSIYDNVHRIVISLGDGDVPFSFLHEAEGKFIHVFDRSFPTIMNELDTITDFCKYLAAKEHFLASDRKRTIVISSEVDLMAEYVLHGKTFEGINDYNAIFITDGIWKDIITREEYIRKRKANETSYFCDRLIEITHTCPGDDYREIARELSRLNRFQRRCLAESFFGAQAIAFEQDCVFRRFFTGSDTVYVFLLTPPDYPRESRVAQLSDICYVARGTIEDTTKVLGIATENVWSPSHTSFDFTLLDIPDSKHVDREVVQKIQDKYGVLVSPKKTRVHFNEYPEGME